MFSTTTTTALVLGVLLVSMVSVKYSMVLTKYGTSASLKRGGEAGGCDRTDIDLALRSGAKAARAATCGTKALCLQCST